MKILIIEGSRFVGPHLVGIGLKEKFDIVVDMCDYQGEQTKRAMEELAFAAKEVMNDDSDDLDQQRADWEGMWQREYVDEELERVFDEDMYEGMTPG